MSWSNPIGAEKAKQSYNVLLVEDNRVNRLIGERLLKKWGYATFLATDGLEALKLSALNSFDLILMNLQMPGLSGRETAGMIRKLGDRYQHLPIIAVTSNRTMLGRELEPFTDLLEVPYMPEQLKNLLEQYLERPVFLSAQDHLQARLNILSGNDPIYRMQLLKLFVKNCRELVNDLQLGRLDNAEYLNRVRHKHRSSLRLLELYSLEAALDNLQEALDHPCTDTALLSQRKQALAEHAGAVVEELSLLAA